jgi:hypothetical protein
MVSFPTCSIRDSRLFGQERKGFLPPTEVSRWRLEKEGDVSLPQDDEVVMIAPFYECGFELPLHSFVRGLLFFYGLEIQKLHPNSVLQMVCCITLCEAYLRIDLHWKLWQYFFSGRVTPSRGNQLYVGLVNFQLRSVRKAGYFRIPLPTSVRFEGEWFYIKNLAGIALCFTGRESVLTDD